MGKTTLGDETLTAIWHSIEAEDGLILYVRDELLDIHHRVVDRSEVGAARVRVCVWCPVVGRRAVRPGWMFMFARVRKSAGGHR